MSTVNFESYLHYAGLSKQEAAYTAAHLKSWDDLHRWLSENQENNFQPVPDRVPIGTPFLETNWRINLWNRLRKVEETHQPVGEPPLWPKVVDRRRQLAMIFSLGLTALMTIISNITLVTEHISDNWRHAYLIIYAIMTYFMIATFAKLGLGSWHALRGPAGNPWHPSHTARDPRANVRTAIIYPVYHEDAARVVAGLTATWESIKRHTPDYASQYDLFLLSDSRKPEYWVAEQAALHTAQAANPDARFYYRWRPSNHNAKLGNVIDFCRRWGKTYEYMVVMDADSIMNGGTIHSMVRMMEGNHRLGILQSNPTPILRESLFGRMQQFAGRLYGSAFSYSLQAMYMGHAQYIGHNAIIRMDPFIKYCILPELSGSSPWGGKPLSHDIIEAAMMARMGYEVWFMPELKGSYEEIPANILGFLIRERRWMQGNLQHLRFLFVNGLHTIHRETFLNGLMGYLSAPLWAAFLFVSAYSMVSFLRHGTLNLGAMSTVEVPAMLMLAASMVFLFLPRILAIVLNFSKPRARLYGGRTKIIVSILLETIFSMFFAPIIMIYITKFVWQWAIRKSVSWGTQQRDDAPLPWLDCFRHFGWIMVIGLLCSYLLYRQVMLVPAQTVALMSLVSGHLLSPASVFFWFFPILGGFVLSALIVRFTSRSFPLLRKVRLFAIPEEVEVPPELSDLEKWEQYLRQHIPDPEQDRHALRYAISDSFFYVRHRPQTRIKPHIADALLPKIRQGIPLTIKEFTYAIRERRCYDALHQAAILGNMMQK